MSLVFEKPSFNGLLNLTEVLSNRPHYFKSYIMFDWSSSSILTYMDWA